MRAEKRHGWLFAGAACCQTLSAVPADAFWPLRLLWHESQQRSRGWVAIKTPGCAPAGNYLTL